MITERAMKNLTTLLAMLICASSVLGTTLYVSPTGSNVYPFADWATAATNIQDAVDAAVDGDTVMVGDGL